MVLLPPQYIKPYVKRGKNDAIDAAAICEAMSRPEMRFVPVKSAEDQAALMLLKVRDLLVKQRTMLINAIRGHAAEFGVIGAKGPPKIADLLQRIGEDTTLPALAREMVVSLAGQLAALEVRLKDLEAKLMVRYKTDAKEPVAGDNPGHRPDRRAQLCPQSARGKSVSLRPPLCRLAWHHAARAFDRRPSPARPDQPAGG